MSEVSERLAEVLGEMPEARNVFDMTDEATTMIEAPVEDVADALAPVVEQMLAEARAAVAGVEYLAERASRKGYDLDPDDVLAALAEPTGPETTQNGPCAPISGPTSPRRVSADHRDATDPEETK